MKRVVFLLMLFCIGTLGANAQTTWVFVQTHWLDPGDGSPRIPVGHYILQTDANTQAQLTPYEQRSLELQQQEIDLQKQEVAAAKTTATFTGLSFGYQVVKDVVQTTTGYSIGGNQNGFRNSRNICNHTNCGGRCGSFNSSSFYQGNNFGNYGNYCNSCNSYGCNGGCWNSRYYQNNGVLGNLLFSVPRY